MRHNRCGERILNRCPLQGQLRMRISIPSSSNIPTSYSFPGDQISSMCPPGRSLGVSVHKFIKATVWRTKRLKNSFLEREILLKRDTSCGKRSRSRYFLWKGILLQRSRYFLWKVRYFFRNRDTSMEIEDTSLEIEDTSLEIEMLLVGILSLVAGYFTFVAGSFCRVVVLLQFALLQPLSHNNK